MIKRKKGILKMCTLLLAGTLMLTGCAGGATGSGSKNEKETITITDSAGREVTLEKDIDRIVLIRSRDIFELEVLLGDEMPKKLVGWSDDLQTNDSDTYKKIIETFPEMESIPSVGNNANDTISAEAVLALEPDLVLMNVSMAKNGNFDYVQKLEEANLPIVYLDSVSNPLSSPQESMALLGKILGKEEKADQIIDYMNKQVETVMSRMENIEENSVSTYIEIGNGGASKIANTFGSSPEKPDKVTSWGVILDALKVDNIAKGVSASSPLNSEYILEKNPDVIVITGQGWEKSGTMEMGYYAETEKSQEILKSYTERTGWNTLSAVKNKEVYSLYHGFPPHVFAFAGLQGLAKAYYPEVFADLDPNENLKEFYEKFMPEQFSGEWFLKLQ